MVHTLAVLEVNTTPNPDVAVADSVAVVPATPLLGAVKVMVCAVLGGGVEEGDDALPPPQAVTSMRARLLAINAMIRFRDRMTYIS
jgi:hypothetical protein